MFDIFGIIRVIVSLWPFLREHLFENKKILRYFENSPSNLMLFITHIVVLFMIINLIVGVGRMSVVQLEQASELARAHALIDDLNAQLQVKRADIETLRIQQDRDKREIEYLNRLLNFFPDEEVDDQD